MDELVRMEAEILSRAFRVSDPRAARVFADPQLIRLLLAFVGAPEGLAAAAAAADMPLGRAHYHFGKLTRAGLVRPAGQRKRAGRPITLHQAAADAFFVPAELTEGLMPGDLGGEPAGKLVYRDAEGRNRISRIRGGNNGRSALPLRMSATLRLDPATARALAEELAAVIGRYRSAEAGRQTYWINVSVAASGGAGATTSPRLAGRIRGVSATGDSRT